MMTYHETVDYLFSSLPVFQTEGGSAYKPGLYRVRKLLSLCGNPEKNLRAIHVAGTNGKGSSSTLLASVLTTSGQRTGLFTSPHLVDFRERIRIDGEMISEEYVVDFVHRMRSSMPDDLEPSFFELTTAMAFSWFVEQQVDVAVIEVGMGGRLDATNVIQPLVSLITSVSMDHTAYLGNTLSEIAYEKAGIIKPFTPVVLSRSVEREVLITIQERAEELDAPLTIADRSQELMMYTRLPEGGYRLTTHHFGTFVLPLDGEYQIENARGVLEVLKLLSSREAPITAEHVRQGCAQVATMGLHGRLETILRGEIEVILDTGHNPGAWQYISAQLHQWSREGGVVCLIGMAADKEVEEVLQQIPKQIPLFVTNAKNPRAMSAAKLLSKANRLDFDYTRAFDDAVSTLNAAMDYAADMGIQRLYIGGSNFLSGELLPTLRQMAEEQALAAQEPTPVEEPTDESDAADDTAVEPQV